MGQAFPLVAGLVLSAAGTGASIAGRNAAKQEQEDTIEKWINMQRQNQAQSSAVFNKSLLGAQPERDINRYKEGTAGRQQLSDSIKREVSATTANSPVTQNSTVDDRGSRLADWSKRMTAGQAAMGGWDDRSITNDLRNLEIERQLYNVGQRSQGLQNIFPYAMTDASHAGDAGQNAGQVLSTIGSLAPYAGGLMKAPTTVMGSSPYRLPQLPTTNYGLRLPSLDYTLKSIQ